jgi:uncharacterized protein (TIGR02300 family)
LRTVAKPELGTKRLCASCGARFYDLSKTPITCPKCGTLFEVTPASTRPRPEQRVVREPEPEAEEVQEAETISLEEADAEAQGKKTPAAAQGTEAAEDGDAEEAIEGDAEDTFIEQEEEEDTDVSEIIGGDIADEEET